MKHLRLFMIVSMVFSPTGSTILAQGTFQNLDFEAATVPLLPPGQSGGLVLFSSAFPSWSGYLGTNGALQAFHNGLSAGSVSMSILGPNYATSQILEGQYTAVLQAGVYADVQLVSATVAQTGIIPTTAESILAKMLVNDANYLSVTFGGQTIPMFSLSVGPKYTLYGGNISALAGQTGELRLTVSPSPSNPFNSLLLDDIIFSNQPIPEPRVLGLFAIGTLLFGWSFRRACSSK